MYLKPRPIESILRDRSKRMSISIRIDSDLLDRIDTIAIHENRSASYVINCLLEDTFREMEEADGPIIVDKGELTRFRNRRGRSPANPHSR